ncbi:MAG: hypothetical protein DYG93_06905 [Leptolyngbya sp. PLA2]|nr:hypothetical protein [Leptolyngbya sp.]MCE7971380.1 hypothetical protein [Leptolyngbya sp. PL-A2]MCQ3940596.1 hypothetical protein [cyanobacterium CYA1]MCZ7632407.1 hypothetical protein [Phycisphaerales bacterium]MDL1903566.1 hypothetical protein [Synechococcales cyanobacterium CNB]GIK20037.1 MAG: hypothetical protein BroJett004_22010 [Planctomycetota bacterium]
MIHPAPTTKIDPRHARGTLLELRPETATKPAFAVITYPNTRYELHLVPRSGITTPPGKRIVGTIHALAKRIDEVGTGGRYVEPVAGRPRRVQGIIVAVEPSTNEIVVNAGVPIHCRPTDPRQKATDFREGQFVSFDVMEGTEFAPLV